MADQDEKTNVPAENETPQEAVEAPEAVAEDTAQAEEVEAPAEATEVQEESPEQEEVDINKYWEERYPAQAPANSNNLADEVSRELAQLPTDETGTVEADAAAQWFANKLSQVSNQAQVEARKAAQEVFLDNAAERGQQEQLLKKYPEITKDKETLDTIFDLRDAAALRGQNLSLLGAAAKLDKLRTSAKAEGQQSATRQTTIQAAAHLETASTKGSPNQGARDRLVSQAFQGGGQEAKEARKELLKQFVEKEISEGRIEHP